MHCGACCAYFRVSFYWAEMKSGGGVVPDEFTEPLTPFLSCMKGTNEKQPRCEKLIGEVGECVSCAIYEQRPSPCREFEQSWANGVKMKLAIGQEPLLGFLLFLIFLYRILRRTSEGLAPPESL